MDLTANGVVAFEHAGGGVLVADVEGDVMAFAVSGPAARRLTRAVVAEGHVRCPLHGWAIDPELGRCGAAERCRYERLPVAVEGSEIRVTLPPS
jgi:nitrite reductase/ring-hydroxylating ferredoxin subunit